MKTTRTPMKLLDGATLERSSIVANARMNRKRGAVGVNSYEREIGIDPIEFLIQRLRAGKSASWLDLCCGSGRALVQAAAAIHGCVLTGNLTIHGIDLIDMFDSVSMNLDFLKLEAASLRVWSSDRNYDLITCVHGLHYVGDKLNLIERAAGWLTGQGSFYANLDSGNLRLTNGQPMAGEIGVRFRECGIGFNSRRHLLTIHGSRTISLGYNFVGADDAAGANYSGQEAVDSYYGR